MWCAALTDPNVIHVTGRVDRSPTSRPSSLELALADLAVVERTMHRDGKKAKSGDKDAQQLVAGAGKAAAAPESGQSGTHFRF